MAQLSVCTCHGRAGGESGDNLGVPPSTVAIRDIAGNIIFTNDKDTAQLVLVQRVLGDDGNFTDIGTELLSPFIQLSVSDRSHGHIIVSQCPHCSVCALVGAMQSDDSESGALERHHSGPVQ